jgi:hypothetical protein
MLDCVEQGTELGFSEKDHFVVIFELLDELLLELLGFFTIFY